MPRSFDLNPVAITHHPTQRIDTAIGKLPPFDIQQIIDGFLTALKDLTGIDLTGIRDFLEELFGAIDWSNLPTPADVWAFVVAAGSLPAQIVTFINANAGINLASWDDFVASLADGKGIDLPLLKFGLDTLAGLFGGISMGDPMTPAERMEWAVTHLIEPLNLLLGPNSPLSAANLFGRLGLGQFGGGVPLNALTPSVANELEPFTALSVPTSDGWSFNATEDAAQLICDGSPKALYLKSGVIKVEEGQPLDTSIDVKYSGVTSGAGQTIRFVLETFTTDDGSGTATPVIVGGVTNPSGTAGPVTLGDSSWDIPPGVKSVRPVLEADELITAGTVFWLNTPELFKQLAGPLAGGLPAAIQARIDDLQATWDKFKGGVGGTVDDIEGALDGAGQAIRDAIANALGHAGSGHTSANILTYLQNIPKTVVDGLEDWWDLITGKTANITTGGLFDAGKLSNVTGTIAQSLVTGLPTSLSDLQTTLNQIGDIFDNSVVTPINDVVQAVKDWWNTWFGGGSTNAIPLSQKGAVNGVAPLDSNRLIPSIYLPASSGGGGEPTEHILFTLPANQSIPSGTATALTGWTQVGSMEATFDDGTNTRWTFPKAGWWDIQSQVVWASSTTGKRQSAIVRGLSSGSVVPAIDGESADNFPSWGVRNAVRAVQDVAARAPLAASDKFSIEAYQNSGGALNAVAGYPDGTYVLAVYLGERESEFIGFYEENTNRTNQAIPAGALGCWVTLIGGGGAGGSGQQASNAKGGAGGGGGAIISRSWIPIAALGTTYSVTRGLGGISGNGAASTFSSGSVSLSAGGGARGATGDASAGSGGGAGGTASASGVTVTSAPGTAGGNVGTAAGSNPGVDNTAGGAAGGGSGAYRPGSNSGGDGGDTTAQTGDTGTASGRGGGGAGVFGNGSFAAGGDGGGGGGGSVGTTSGGAPPGGAGGNGYTLIEWE